MLCVSHRWCCDVRSIDNFITCYPKSYMIKSTSNTILLLYAYKCNKFWVLNGSPCMLWHWHTNIGDFAVVGGFFLKNENKVNEGERTTMPNGHLWCHHQRVAKRKGPFSKLGARLNWAGSFISPNMGCIMDQKWPFSMGELNEDECIV